MPFTLLDLPTELLLEIPKHFHGYPDISPELIALRSVNRFWHAVFIEHFHTLSFGLNSSNSPKRHRLKSRLKVITKVNPVLSIWPFKTNAPFQQLRHVKTDMDVISELKLSKHWYRAMSGLTGLDGFLVKFGNCSKKIETMGLVQKSLDRVCARNNLTSLSIEYQPMGMRGQYLDLKVFPLTRLSIGDAQHHNMDVLSKAVAACPFLDTLCIFWNTTIPNFNVWELFMHVPTETTLPLRELRLKGFYSSALPPLEYMRHLRGLERLSFLGKRWLNLLDDLFERFIEYRIFPAELCLEQVSTALLRYLKHDNHPGLRVLDISEERCTRFSSRFGMPLVTGSQEMNLVREAIKDHFDTHPPRERMRLVLKYCSIVN